MNKCPIFAVKERFTVCVELLLFTFPTQMRVSGFKLPTEKLLLIFELLVLNTCE